MSSTSVTAQTVNRIDVAAKPPTLLRGHLDLGGVSASGDAITVTSHYLEWNGQPFIPVVGEFHFSRYPAQYWEESLRKMKAGGITVVATYVFWNLHERREGEFDWTGDLNLREFLRLCRLVGLQAIVRIGPFCHGEIRNGGIPDWTYGRDFEIRSNDPGYLKLVERLYGQIAAQVRDELFSRGGPVIGIQLENEYQHSAAPWEISYPGSPREATVAERDLAVTHVQVTASERQNAHLAEGRDHMATLKKIAKDHGLVVPLYTATGWGNAAIVDGGSIPVTAAYAYPFWEPASPSPFYLYKDIRRDPDYSPVSYDTEQYPAMPAEVGAGIMPIYDRRRRVPPESVPPLMVRMIGSGSNGIGYYMFHGGSTPALGRFFSEEWAGSPKINYDYQAPIGEFGQTRRHYHALKPLHLFLASYGSQLAPMHVVLPPTNAAIKPGDTNTLRYVVRTHGGSGFVFMHNFQDHIEQPDKRDQRILVNMGDDEIAFPSKGVFTLPSGGEAILPFNLNLGEVKLRSATVQPLTTLTRPEGTHHVFVSLPGLPVELLFEGDVGVTGGDVHTERVGKYTRVSGDAGRVLEFSAGSQTFLLIPHAMAVQAWKVSEGQLFFSSATLLPEGRLLKVLPGSNTAADVHAYPALPTVPAPTGARLEKCAPAHPSMSAFRLRFADKEPPFKVERISSRKYRVRATSDWIDCHDVVMTIDYAGDRCMVFIDGTLVADDLYFGLRWEIGLRRWRDQFPGKEMIVIFHPIVADHKFLGDLAEDQRPKFEPGEKSYLRVNDISFATQYEGWVHLQ